MKWYNQNIKEQLSAYTDDELQKHEKDLLEDKLIASPELRAEAEANQKLKENLASLKRLPNDEYFTTRLMEKIKSEKKSDKFFSFLKKPVVAFGIISISMMGILKFYPNFFPTFISKQKSTILDFYTQNMKPFIYVADLSSDDIFNFAFNNNLPLNKEDRQMLQLQRDTNGNEFVEVKYAGAVQAAVYNLPQFVKSLNLTKSQKMTVDSILLSYADDISSHILVNEKNTVAVNPRIWNYHNAIRSDLLSYVASVNKDISHKIMPAGFPENTTASVRSLPKFESEDGDTYFVFCPDTIFSQKLHVNKNQMKVEIQKFKNELNRQGKEENKLKRYKIDVKVFPNEFAASQEMHVIIDSNICRVQIPREIAMQNFLPNFDSVNDAFDLAFDQLRNLNFNFRIESNDKENLVSYGEKKKRKNEQKFEFKIGDEKIFVSSPDSIANFFRKYFSDPSASDSGKVSGNPFGKFDYNTNQDIEVFKREMEKFKSEIEKMKKELQKDLNKTQVKKDPLEI